MKKLFLLFSLLIAMQVSAQEKFRINFKNGTVQDFSVSNIKSVTSIEEAYANIIGEWATVSSSSGIDISYTFNGDGTFSTYQYYSKKTYPKTEISSTYTRDWNSLTLTMYGIDYLYGVIDATEYNIGLVDAGGSKTTLYKVVKEYNISTDGDSIALAAPGESIKYAADNCFVGINNNKIYGKKAGTGYILYLDNSLNEIVAYKINVTAPAPPTIHFEDYFGQAETEIIAKFGDKNTRLEKEGYHTLSYYKYNDDLSLNTFYIDNETSKVYKVTATFSSTDKFNAYAEDIASRYTLDPSSTSTRKKYYDNADTSQRKVSIAVSTSTGMITYTDYTY